MTGRYILEKFGAALYLHRALQKRASKGIQAVEYFQKVAKLLRKKAK